MQLFVTRSSDRDPTADHDYSSPVDRVSAAPVPRCSYTDTEVNPSDSMTDTTRENNTWISVTACNISHCLCTWLPEYQSLPVHLAPWTRAPRSLDISCCPCTSLPEPVLLAPWISIAARAPRSLNPCTSLPGYQSLPVHLTPWTRAPGIANTIARVDV